MIGLQWQKWLNRSRFYRIEFCLLAVGKTKNDLLVVLLDHLIINEKESEGLWWSTTIHVYVIRPINVVDLHNSSVTTQLHDRFIHVKLSFHLNLEKRIVTLPNVLCSK